MPNPPLQLKCTIDAFLLIFHRGMHRTFIEARSTVEKKKDEVLEEMHHYSFDTKGAIKLMSDYIVARLATFRERGGHINDETLELLEPYCRICDFGGPEALTVFGTLGGLPAWVSCQLKFEAASKAYAPQLHNIEHLTTRLKDVKGRRDGRRTVHASAVLQLDSLRSEQERAGAERTELIAELKNLRDVLKVVGDVAAELGAHQAQWVAMQRSFAERSHADPRL